MNQPSPISLRFGAEIPAITRARMSYAFRLFAAIYNYRVIEAGNDSNAIRCVYSRVRPQEIDSQVLWIPARHQVSSVHPGQARFLKRRYLTEDFYLLDGIDETTGNPDWLGEIFVWVSSALEMGIENRDSVGRIPRSEMAFNRQGIPPEKPHAAMMMGWLENALRSGGDALPRAPSPVSGVEHFVVSSHDVDFYFTNKRHALLRLLKNLGIAIRPYRSRSFLQSNSKMLAKLIGGKRIGDYLPALIAASEECGFHSTLFVVSQKMHRRDPDYTLEELMPRLSEASGKNFCVALHGSYTSVVEAENLVSEASALARVTGTTPMGNRQHWLRFDRHDKLFEAVEKARLAFDSSLGFNDMVGFRNGASFAFPPYDFKNEKPHEFLEIPLVIMDGGLEAAARSLGTRPQKIADDLLAESRRWGWGGMSVLWHNPIEPIQVPDSINRVFWECVKKKQLFQEEWTDADQFIACCLSRYQNAGLLQSVRIATKTCVP